LLLGALFLLLFFLLFLHSQLLYFLSQPLSLSKNRCSHATLTNHVFVMPRSGWLLKEFFKFFLHLPFNPIVNILNFHTHSCSNEKCHLFYFIPQLVVVFRDHHILCSFKYQLKTLDQITFNYPKILIQLFLHLPSGVTLNFFLILFVHSSSLV